MFKMTFSKIKKLCSVAFIPRILRDEVTLSPQKLGKRPLNGLWKMTKSTDSKDREAECEKCKKIIEMVFGREKPDNLLKQVGANIEDIQMDKIQKVITPSITVNEKSNTCNKLLPIETPKKEIESVQKNSADVINEPLTKNPESKTALPLNNILKSTTSKNTEEQLAQKLETIEEPGLVEAATPKIDGFNTCPNVLGGQENKLDSKNSLCMKIGPEEDAMDDIAKKCLSAPPDKIDQRILEEMKSCGMLGRGWKKPTPGKSSYSAMKCKEKELFLERKSEQNMLYYKNLQNNSGYHNPQDMYPAYFLNYGRLDKKMELQKITELKHNEEKILTEAVKTGDEEKILPISSDKSENVNRDTTSPVINNQTCTNTEILEEVSTQTVITEEQPTNIIENVEGELEEIRVTTANANRLGMPGDTEIDPDSDNKHIKPNILPYSEMLQAPEIPIEEKSIEPDKLEHVVLSNSKHPQEWHYRPDLPGRPLNNPNTAISGTYPTLEQKQDQEPTNLETSISSKQDPAEYFDLSHCNMEKAKNNDVMTLSEIQLLPAYHQYTIITGSDKGEESEHAILSAKDPPEIRIFHAAELKYELEIEKPDLVKTLNKDISAAMGPLPQLKDMEEELPLTELLRRVRERNRLQYYRELAFKAVETEPIEANKCPPPLEKPGKTLGPGPCKPKPKPACPPPPPACPPASPCKPKDPCAKFTNTAIIGDKIKEAFTLVLQIALKPAFASPILTYRHKKIVAEPLTEVLDDEDSNRTEKLGSFLLSSYPESKKKGFESEDVILAKDYEPWSPIPSWPIPKKEKKQPFVCPKEGCKVLPPPPPDYPCKERPCTNFPKKTFSLIEYEYEPLYLHDNKFWCFIK